jgi:hypothetical protein
VEQARVAFSTFMIAQRAVSHLEDQAKAMRAGGKDVSENR